MASKSCTNAKIRTSCAPFPAQSAAGAILVFWTLFLSLSIAALQNGVSGAIEAWSTFSSSVMRNADSQSGAFKSCTPKYGCHWPRLLAPLLVAPSVPGDVCWRTVLCLAPSLRLFSHVSLVSFMAFNFLVAHDAGNESAGSKEVWCTEAHSEQRGLMLTALTLAVAGLPSAVACGESSHECIGVKHVKRFRYRGTQHPFWTGTIQLWMNISPSICGCISWPARRSERKRNIATPFKQNSGLCQRLGSFKACHSSSTTSQGLSNVKTCVQLSRLEIFLLVVVAEEKISREPLLGFVCCLLCSVPDWICQGVTIL